MTKETAIKLFNEKQIRTHWDDELEKWYFSIVDVVGILTDQPTNTPRCKKLLESIEKQVS